MKRFIVGITGGIAAYKAAILIRLLIKQGAEVKVIMTPFSKKFITPLTLATLSKNPILVDFYNPENGDWNSHVDLGLWADAMIIAPATANTMAKMANGVADNLLVTTYLSARCPVFFAPAMDFDMYKHQSTLNNINKLKSYGNHFIEASSGELASGLHGKGRMQEPEIIVETVNKFFENSKKLKGKTALVTAGPTFEQIDPVRFIGNNSTGKMGYAIAESLAKHGATVNIISGPVSVTTNNKNIKIIKVRTAAEMFEKTTEYFKNSEIAIMAAAVADYTPVVSYNEKIKKKPDKMTIELKPTKDIAASLGLQKTKSQILVGFALETTNELSNAISKLERKNFDFIVLNSLNDKGAGFEHDTNKITIIDKNNNIEKFELKSKNKVADDIVNKVATL